VHPDVNSNMPLVVLCGLPCSGKTTRAKQLKQYFENERKIRATIVGDHEKGLLRNEMYSGQ
jgi:protein KTI12